MLAWALARSAPGVPILGDCSRARVYFPDLVEEKLREPRCAVGCRYNRVNASGALSRHGEFLNFGGLGVQPPNLVHWSIGGHPEVPIFVWSRTPRHAIRPRQIVFHVHN